MKKNIFRFGVVGGVTTSIDFAVYWMLSKYMDITLAKLFSMLCSSVVSYLLNKVWTFENEYKTNGIYLVKFYIVFAINICVNLSVNRIVYMCTNYKILAFVIATGCAMVINFLLQRFWVFKPMESSKL